jgi:hypothetical protein
MGIMVHSSLWERRIPADYKFFSINLIIKIVCRYWDAEITLLKKFLLISVVGFP